MFIEHLPCARGQGYFGHQNGQAPCPHEALYLERKGKSLNLVRLSWTVAYQAPLSMGFSRQWYWSGLPFPSPVDLPDPGIDPSSPALAGKLLTTVPPGKPMEETRVSTIQD